MSFISRITEIIVICKTIMYKVPAYENYTLDQLYDAYYNVDRDKYPKNFNAIVDELNKRKANIPSEVNDDLDTSHGKGAISLPNSISRLLIPRYDEISLFTMSVAFILLYLTDEELRIDAYKFVYTDIDIRGYFFIFIVFSGMVLSLIHIILKREKTDIEKTLMLIFAIMVNGLSGIAAGSYMLKNAHGVLMIFPIWNIINGVLLLLMFRLNFIDESCIVGENTPIFKTIVGSIAVFSAFYVCQYMFELYWAVTFSICVAYATNLSGLVQRSICGLRSDKMNI
jgi:hypothetical protein